MQKRDLDLNLGSAIQYFREDILCLSALKSLPRYMGAMLASTRWCRGEGAWRALSTGLATTGGHHTQSCLQESPWSLGSHGLSDNEHTARSEELQQKSLSHPRRAPATAPHLLLPTRHGQV